MPIETGQGPLLQVQNASGMHMQCRQMVAEGAAIQAQDMAITLLPAIQKAARAISHDC